MITFSLANERFASIDYAFIGMTHSEHLPKLIIYITVVYATTVTFV